MEMRRFGAILPSHRTMDPSAQQSFQALFAHFEYRVGRVLLPLDRTAQEPAALVSTQAVCLDLAREAAVGIYRANGCQQLEDAVTLWPTLNALGELKAHYRRCGKLDVMNADFLEALGRATLAFMDERTARIESAPIPAVKGSSETKVSALVRR